MREEIQTAEFGNGLEYDFGAAEAADLRGILNGVDYCAVGSSDGRQYCGALLVGRI